MHAIIQQNQNADKNHDDNNCLVAEQDSATGTASMSLPSKPAEFSVAVQVPPQDAGGSHKIEIQNPKAKTRWFIPKQT